MFIFNRFSVDAVADLRKKDLSTLFIFGVYTGFENY